VTRLLLILHKILREEFVHFLDFLGLLETRRSRTNNADNDCEVVEERQLDCGTSYVFTVWAYSPTGLQGEQVKRFLNTNPCGLS
jgi:hypothetical protein